MGAGVAGTVPSMRVIAVPRGITILARLLVIDGASVAAAISAADSTVVPSAAAPAAVAPRVRIVAVVIAPVAGPSALIGAQVSRLGVGGAAVAVVASPAAPASRSDVSAAAVMIAVVIARPVTMSVVARAPFLGALVSSHSHQKTSEGNLFNKIILLLFRFKVFVDVLTANFILMRLLDKSTWVVQLRN